jgi:HEAT repeat protein
MVLPIPSLSLLTSLASSVLATVTLGTLAVAAVAMVRRWHHDRFDRRVKNLRLYYGLTPSGLLQGKYSPQCLARLRALPLPTLEFLLEPLLLKCSSAPPLAGVLQGLCLELGMIDVWQRRLLGQFTPVSLREALTIPEGLLHFVSRLHFLLRARSARNLGLLRHQASWPILTQALDDPHADVRQVALRSLAALREASTVPALLGQMDKAVSENRAGLSLYSLRAALAEFPLSQAMQLLPAMRHPHPQVRGAAAEILREMAKREPVGAPAFFQFKSVFDGELARLASDADPRVRAIAAEAAAHLDFAVPSPRVRQGFEDARRPVRTGALQALAEQPRPLPPDQIQPFLTDAQRTVRQAALRALLACGREGVSRLYEQFLKTEDKGLRNEIVEELEHAGLLLSLLQNLGDSPGNLETKVVQQLVSMGATRHLQEALTNTSGRHLLESLLEKLETHSPPKIDAWLELCAGLKAPREWNKASHGPSKLAA